MAQYQITAWVPLPFPVAASGGFCADSCIQFQDIMECLPILSGWEVVLEHSFFGMMPLHVLA